MTRGRLPARPHPPASTPIVSISAQLFMPASRRRLTRQPCGPTRSRLRWFRRAMTSAATLFGITIVGTVFWLASPEAAVALFASTQKTWNPAIVGLVGAGGQAVSLTLLFLFGD